MSISIQFDTNNAAFESYKDEIEMIFGRILWIIQDHEKECLDFPIFDSNGNTIGEVVIKDDFS